MFDPRNDADSLQHLHGVGLAGVLDLQILYTYAQRVRGKFLQGLSKALTQTLPASQAAKLAELKAAGRALFDGEDSGAVWARRPLDPVLVQYAAADVLCLFALHKA